MAAYLIGAINIQDEAGYQKYRAGIAAAMAPHDIEILSTDDRPMILEGAQPAGHLFIIKFASVAAVDAFYASGLYQKIIHHRHASSETAFLMVMRSVDALQS